MGFPCDAVTDMNIPLLCDLNAIKIKVYAIYYKNYPLIMEISMR